MQGRGSSTHCVCICGVYRFSKGYESFKSQSIAKMHLKTACYVTVHVKPGTETLEQKRHEIKMETTPIMLILTVHGHR